MEHALLEDAEIQHQIYTEMKKFMHASVLKKTARHKAKDTYIHFWKQYSKEYHNKRTEEWTRPFTGFQMSDEISMWMSSAGEANHLTGLQAARIFSVPMTCKATPRKYPRN